MCVRTRCNATSGYLSSAIIGLYAFCGLMNRLYYRACHAAWTTWANIGHQMHMNHILWFSSEWLLCRSSTTHTAIHERGLMYAFRAHEQFLEMFFWEGTPTPDSHPHHGGRECDTSKIWAIIKLVSLSVLSIEFCEFELPHSHSPLPSASR